jgi:hypothetical protein
MFLDQWIFPSDYRSISVLSSFTESNDGNHSFLKRVLTKYESKRNTKIGVVFKCISSGVVTASEYKNVRMNFGVQVINSM